MTPVSWVITPPDLIEQIVAVLLGNRYDRCFRIRPSRGDGGLDILVPTEMPGHFDDYHVKRFATKLERPQKRQIVGSLEAAIKTHNDPDAPFLIDTWYLTLPLILTREQRGWLASEAERLESPFSVEWRDYDFLERLAADYPQVIDYYLHDGKDRLDAQIKALRDLGQLGISDTGAVLEPKDVVERLGSLGQALNREDPHYRYDFEVTEREPLLFERPHLLASVIAGLPGSFVTFHVYARYPDAVWDRPLPISFNVSEASLTAEQLKEFNNMVRYGTAMTPAVAKLDEEDYANIVSVGRLLRGELVPITWTSITAHIRADVSFGQGVLKTTQSLTVTFMGDSYDVGQVNTYLLSPRIEAEFDAKPDADGTIPITIIPDENDQAITTSRDLTPDEAQALSVNVDTASA